MRGLDSKISKNLPSDLRKLKCKVSSIHLKFMAMRLQLHILLFGLTLKLGDIIDVLGGFPCVEIFASDLGTWKQVCRENAEEGALHCFSLARGERCEGDDWLPVRFLAPVYNERKMHPELLTARSTMSYHERKLAGLCSPECFRSCKVRIPLQNSVPIFYNTFNNLAHLKRLRKVLGAPPSANTGGSPFGGHEALLPV